ncbi:MAG TPA: AraC family transcriptional regulator [Cyclobacteriaceae bacterium]|nr:AraC family transcriptional regulator [Cyclobacteriaceae bacterium]
MKIYIKNMVCNRCIRAVGDVFREAGYEPAKINLGDVDIAREIPEAEFRSIDHQLRDLGFEIIDDKKSRIIEKIHNTIIEQIHHRKENLKVNFSTLIESSLKKDYNYLSNLFSSVTGSTIEKYIIDQKIERVKELLVYDELSLNEIAFEMGYSSAAHLSNQFKKVTGLTPGHFKKVGMNRRKPLDKVK